MEKVREGALNPEKILKRLKAGMSDMESREEICRWLLEEMESRSSKEFSHYLTDLRYECINPGFVLTLRFPFGFDFMNRRFSKAEFDIGEFGCRNRARSNKDKV